MDPRWTEYPPTEWFSPPPALVRRQLLEAGFDRVRCGTLRSRVTIADHAARETLRRWHVRDAFWDRYRPRLMGAGMEFPDWCVVSAQKPEARR